MRYFMIDRITRLETGKSADGIKCITLSEDILQDHFPDYPVFPGALLIESMAQLAGFLLEMTFNKPGSIRRALLAQVKNAKFHAMAEPGDQLLVTVEIKQHMDDAARVGAFIKTTEKKIATAELTFAMKTIDSERIHQQRRTFYKIWTKNLENIPPIL